MKKIVLSLVLILTLCLSLVACAEDPVTKEDWINTLVNEKGLTLTENSTEGDELELANAKLNLEISAFSGNFKVEILSFTHLTKDGDTQNACKIIEFATEDEAIKYAGFYINKRGDNSLWRVAKDGNVVVITNLDAVPEVVNLIFK